MEKLQYDSFYKFLVSLGIILLTAPILGICYLIGTGNELLISKKDYLGLSDNSLIILNKRDDMINFILDWLPYIMIIFIVAGLIFLIYGGIKWRSLQKEIDEQTRLKTIERRTNVEKMTTGEIFEKAITENLETVSDVGVEYNKDMSFLYDGERILKSFQIEEFCFKQILDKLGNDYYVQQNVKVANEEFDVIANSKYTNVDYLFEIKYWVYTPSFKHFKQVLENFIARSCKYQKSSNRYCEPVFIVVIPEENFDKVTQKLESYIKECDVDEVKMEFLQEIEIDANYNKKIKRNKYSN